MTNSVKSTLIDVVGRKKAGANLTKAIEDAPGLRGTGVSYGTLARWIAAGLIERTRTSAGTRYTLTAKGAEEAQRCRRLAGEYGRMSEAEKRRRARARRQGGESQPAAS